MSPLNKNCAMSVTPALPVSSGLRLSIVRTTPRRKWPGSVYGCRAAAGRAVAANTASAPSAPMTRRKLGVARAGAASAAAAAVVLHAARMAVVRRGGRRSRRRGVGGDLRVARKHLVDALVRAAQRARQRGADLDHALGEVFGGVQRDVLRAVALDLDAALLPAHALLVGVEHPVREALRVLVRGDAPRFGDPLVPLARKLRDGAALAVERRTRRRQLQPPMVDRIDRLPRRLDLARSVERVDLDQRRLDLFRRAHLRGALRIAAEQL